MAKRGAAVLEMPEPEYAPLNGIRRRAQAGPAARLNRDRVEDFAGEYDASVKPERGRRAPVARPAIKLKLAGRLPLPSSTTGMLATGVALLLLLGGVLWLLAVTRTFLLHDTRFRLVGSSSIEIEGNHHLKRGQVLALFADDIDRNIFGVSLDQRRADLEAISWVKRATVMRLLPGRLRVSLEERTPVAFVRQGAHISLVDANGVLLDMPAGPQTEHYAFPIVTGIAATDPLSTRSARMKLFARFTTELDAGGAKNTESLSEIDLSDPEDVRALVEEHGATVLVHFGEDEFLERFRKVKELLPQWHAQYPNLASADLRYEHEIPLAMAKPVTVAASAAPKHLAKAASAGAKTAHGAVTPHPAVPPSNAVTHPVAPKAHTVVRPMEHAFVPGPAVKPWQPTAASQQAGTTRPSVSAAARWAFAAKQGPSPAPAVARPANALAKAPLQPSRPASLPLPQKHATGKPSAGKPLVPTETDPNPQAQR